MKGWVAQLRAFAPSRLAEGDKTMILCRFARGVARSIGLRTTFYSGGN